MSGPLTSAIAVVAPQKSDGLGPDLCAALGRIAQDAPQEIENYIKVQRTRKKGEGMAKLKRTVN